MKLDKIAVYCASSIGYDPIYMEGAKRLGQVIGSQGKSLVYGGAHVGLMGAVADGVLSEGGKAYGVIPEFLKVKELEHSGLTECFVVGTMHERKAKMAELADAIIALPGGFGTMEELFEMITWSQLKLHEKPIGLLNINGFYNPLMTFVDRMIDSGFVKDEYRSLLLVEEDANRLLGRMEEFVPLANEKWFEPAIVR